MHWMISACFFIPLWYFYLYCWSNPFCFTFKIVRYHFLNFTLQDWWNIFLYDLFSNEREFSFYKRYFSNVIHVKNFFTMTWIYSVLCATLHCRVHQRMISFFLNLSVNFPCWSVWIYASLLYTTFPFERCIFSVINVASLLQTILRIFTHIVSQSHGPSVLLNNLLKR